MMPWPVTPDAPKTSAVRWILLGWEDIVVVSQKKECLRCDDTNLCFDRRNGNIQRSTLLRLISTFQSSLGL